MVTSALTAFLASSIALFVLIIVTQQERRRGRRFFAAGFRMLLDGMVAKFEQKVIRSFNHFMRYIVQLNWYYSIHSVLRTFLKGLIAMYTYFEDLFERNRQRTKELRAEKRQLNELNHLRQMADHKVDTALTPVEKQKLRKKTLEGKV